MNIDGKEWFNRIAWGVITSIAAYGASELKSIVISVETLNKNVAVLIAERVHDRDAIRDLQDRMHEVETAGRWPVKPYRSKE